MGSMPVYSILKGVFKPVSHGKEPILLHHIFEHTVSQLYKVKNNNAEKTESVHSITVNNEVSQETALIYNGRVTSFIQLNESANQLARSIQLTMQKMVKTSHMNPDGDLIVVVCLEPSDILITSLLACWKIGAAYLPLDPTFPKSRIDHILAESKAALVIVNDRAKDLIVHPNVVSIELLQKISYTLDASNINREDTLTSTIPERDLLALVLYTSGSTGVPKGVRISHSAVLNRLKWQWETFPYSSSEAVCVFKTALTFVDSVSEIWGPLLHARSVLVMPKEDTKDAEKVITILEEYGVERLVLVPTLLQSILVYLKVLKKEKPVQELDKLLRRLRLWVCSGELLPTSLVKSFYDQFDIKNHRLCNFYGSTEVMGDVTYHVIDNPLEIEDKIPIGKPLVNCNVYLLNEELNAVNIGEIGEIYVSGLNVASGYVKNRDAHRFLDNHILLDSGHRKLYRTGDFGRISKNTLYYEGRIDSQIKVRGYRIDLSEIDAALKKISLLKESAVLAYRPGQPDQSIVAFVIPMTGSLTSQEVELALKKLIPAYMMPEVFIVESMPLLVNGKLDRQFLLEKYSRDRSFRKETMDFSGIGPDLMERAKVVYSTIVDVLGDGLRNRITRDSNFTSLGGNSLNAVYFVTHLRDVGYRISIADFISAPTIYDVIKRVESEGEVRLVDDATLKELEKKYTVEVLSQEHKQDFIALLSRSFYEKADLERYLLPKVPYSDYEEVIVSLWDELLEEKLSFVVKDSSGVMIGAALNKDAIAEEGSYDPNNNLTVVLEFLEYIELPFLQKKLDEGNRILHDFMMGSRTDLSVQETIELFIFMENEVLNIAQSRNFDGILTSNTSPLTQQLGSDVLGYETLLEYQANTYVTKSERRPFEKAPDSVKVLISWKPLPNKSNKQPDVKQ